MLLRLVVELHFVVEPLFLEIVEIVVDDPLEGRSLLDDERVAARQQRLVGGQQAAGDELVGQGDRALVILQKGVF